ncbi:uncharacterized protein N7459_004110 [Penicillium hispanicum]|uniref:uncharacterized protein n=1 Tax=Penicillium hispanicum TaxID=1080232 RepID=UPI002540F2DD|nr:uncharacterized protein N7459_004110 [Penicillium hispanicum]KAJ5584310.1 hypothetical protein N7459_004110 [Penicillium hispanicum]
MTDSRRNASKHQHRHPRPGKRPALTHFLCLPLVNSASIPQLESSIADFKATYPPVPVADLPPDGYRSAHDHASRPLLPEGAVRPLGTLHLTLGVMNLPTKERLDQALAFFQSLDLAGLLREAERVATERREKSTRRRPVSAASVAKPSSRESSSTESPEPFTISLESLHALPRAKSATVLHASPVDPTGRLYPFCLMLRDVFLEAGFMQAESKTRPPGNGHHTQNDQHTKTGEIQSASSHRTDVEPPQDASVSQDFLHDYEALLNSNSSNQTTQPANSASEDIVSPKDPYAAALSRRPKPRPLLLHATLVNTIYVGVRQKSHMKDKKPVRRIEFDARGILARYRDYYVDETRTTPRAETTQPSQPSTIEAQSGDALSLSSSAEGGGDEEFKDRLAPYPPRYPFVWAKEIPLHSLCICEMGSKKLPVDDGNEDQDLNGRLGEEYTVIAQRSLDLSSRPSSSSTQEGSVDGGVKLG